MAPLDLKIDYSFGSAHVKIGVWPKVGLQALFTAGQGWRNASATPNNWNQLNLTGWNAEPPMIMSLIGWIGFCSYQVRRRWRDEDSDGVGEGDRNSGGNGDDGAKDDAFFKLPAKFAIVQICSVCQWF